MSLDEAPLFTDLMPGPDDGKAWWVTASDGVRIRIGFWGADAPKGTVLLFPGRTEYVEKYGDAATMLRERGFATLAVDWRGQGLADRLDDDRRLGHVQHFNDYQTDVSAVLYAAKALNLPQPWYLLGHSMGGCIGLRALMNGLDVKAAAFSAPMWGIHISAAVRPFAWAISHAMSALGQGAVLSPGTSSQPYVLDAAFEGNTLTRDREMYDMMRQQLNAHTDLSLGGPSLLWLREALDETLALSRMPAPNVPCLTYLGTNERIVQTDRIHDRMRGWSNGHLEMIEGAEHEVLMESHAVRAAAFDGIVAHFSAAS